MEDKKPLKNPSKQEASPKQPQTARGAPFCLRLNTLRALASISVIITHIMPFLNLHPKFRSLHLAGHMGVYLFFALSGYLLTLSLIKEIRRRLSSEDKDKNKTAISEAKKLAESQPPQIQVDVGEKKEKQEIGEPKSPSQITGGSSPLPEGTKKNKQSAQIFSLSAWVKFAQRSILICTLCRFLWNRTWRIFPLFYACCCFLKVADIEGATWHPEPMLFWTWKDIWLLKEFPNHLWSMQIEMKFNYFVIPIYICALYVGFKLQKKGYNMISYAVFSAIVGALIFLGIYDILAADPIARPVYYNEEFFWNLPPFCFGMLAGLLNFTLEQEFNRRQVAAKAKAQAKAETEVEAQKKENEEYSENKDEKPSNSLRGRVLQILKRIAKYTLSELYENRYSIVFWLLFVRILFLNAGFSAFFTKKTELESQWYAVNYHSYWYALFVLINDSRGGFWKFMHTQPEPKPTVLHPTDFHKMVYYYGLWSYIVYLIHPLVFVRLGIYIEKRRFTVEYVVFSVLLCLPLAGLIDFFIDKMLVNKIILGGIVPFIGKILVSKKTTPEVAKVSS